MTALRRFWWVGGLAIAAFVVIVFAPLASKDPDGLESVARQQGFATATQPPAGGVLPDYTVPGLHGGIATVVAGLIGITIVFVLMWGLGKLLARRRAARAD
jgi:cobalt/nickel transport system permease protein